MREPHRQAGIPWTRAAVMVAVIGPALCLGGVPTWVVPAFVVAVALLMVTLTQRGGREIRIPRFWLLGLMASALCLLQLVPLSQPAVELIAPRLSETVRQSLEATEAEGWSRISVLPGATALEAGRMLALTALFVAAAQLSWRVTATAVVAAGTIVSLVGLAHLITGTDAIYGLYMPADRIPGPDAGLLTSFVNPNHQSGLLLLGIFAAIALALDQHHRSHRSHDVHRADRLAERAWVAAGCAGVQLLVLLLSLSRTALLVGAVIAIPCLVLALRGRSRQGLRASARKRALLVAGGLTALTVLAARLGAWQALRTIDRQAYGDKFGSVGDALGLIPMSPVLGSGRGTFVDLFPLVDRHRELTDVTVTHIECFPVAVIVEWGPAFGGALIFAGCVWWVKTFLHRTESPRRIALLGVAAVALQNCADFNLEFLGVAAPMAAVCGSLSVRREHHWPRRKLMMILLPGLLMAGGLAFHGSSRSWPQLRDRHELVGAGVVGEAEALADRPLDARVHAALGRQAAERGDWEQAVTRGRVATELLPSAAEGWLLLAAAEQALGNEHESDEAMRRALHRIRRRPDQDLARHIVANRSPDRLAVLIDPGSEAWATVLGGLTEHEPDYADALVGELAVDHPTAPTIVHHRAKRALERDRPDLALHHARLLCQIAPTWAEAWVLQASAMRHSVRDVEESEIQAVLEQGLLEELDRPGLVEEALILSYVADGQPEALTKAENLLPKLLNRDAVPEVERRRRQLGTTIAQRRREPDPTP